jgi:acetolactate synthase-1/2/3 large subunit
VVECLRQHGVTHVFCIPGAKIDAVFDVLRAADEIELVVCRREQNAAFSAGGICCITGRPGVALVTLGPGGTKLVTGLATATSEGDPFIAIGGNAPNKMRLHATHQNLKNVTLFEAATRYSNEVIDPGTIPKVIANTFRVALATPQGAASDVCTADVDVEPCSRVSPVMLGPAADALVAEAARRIEADRCPSCSSACGPARPRSPPRSTAVSRAARPLSSAPSRPPALSPWTTWTASLAGWAFSAISRVMHSWPNPTWW